MTYPSDPYGGSGQPPQYGQPQYGQPQYQPPQYQPPQYQPPQYQPPQYQQPQYQPPQYQPPQYGQPEYQPPQYQQPQYQPPQYGQPQYGPQFGPSEPLPLTPPPGRGGRGKFVAAAAAAVVVIGGGVATYAAVSSSSAGGGAGDPKSAVKTLVGDLNDSDLIGLLDDLPPGERDAISKPVQRTLELMKKNDILRPDANLNKVGGVSIKATDLTFGKTFSINDHVRVVEVTGGRLEVDADLAKAPFTSDFLRAVHATSSESHTSSTVDIGQKVKETGKPLRIATQQVGGKWYPSLLYSIADNAVTDGGMQAPSAADRIPANGAASADDAVQGFVTALLEADPERAAELLSPSELAVVHDYGKLVLDQLKYSPTGAKIKDVQFKDESVDGGVLVTVKSIEITSGSDTIKAELDGDCATVTAEGRTQRMCAGQLISEFGGLGGGGMTAAQRRALSDLFSGLMQHAGIITTKVDGKWYVNPVRSYLDLVNAMLSGLQGDDMKELLKLAGD